MKQKLFLLFALCALLAGCSRSGEPTKWETEATNFTQLIEELDTVEKLSYNVFYADTVRHIYYLDVTHSNHPKFAIFGYFSPDAERKNVRIDGSEDRAVVEFWKVPYDGDLSSAYVINFCYTYDNKNVKDDKYSLIRNINLNYFELKRNKDGVFKFYYSLYEVDKNTGESKIFEYDTKRIKVENSSSAVNQE